MVASLVYHCQMLHFKLKIRQKNRFSAGPRPDLLESFQSSSYLVTGFRGTGGRKGEEGWKEIERKGGKANPRNINPVCEPARMAKLVLKLLPVTKIIR